MKRLCKMIIVTLMFTLCMGMTVSAKDSGISQYNFDYDWYLEKHPDLAAIIPADDHEAIWNFYKTTGEPAGWIGRRTQLSYYSKYTFDYDYFMANNPDVVTALGTDKDVLFDWYVTMGYAANRPAKSTSETTNAIIRIYDLAEEITNDTMSDREKVKAVHDWLCINVAYDMDNYYANTIPDRSYNIEGPIFYGKSVCSGYARTFKMFMNVLGIDCDVVSGDAYSMGTTGGHAWNRVKIDGQWLYIDVTWDDPIPDRPGIVYRYKYFLISESQMNHDHFPERTY